MIASVQEYEKAKAELAHLEKWLERLQMENPLPQKGLTKAGVRKMIARLHEELGVYEGTREIDRVTRNDTVPN
jgi:hypothetical protein